MAERLPSQLAHVEILTPTPEESLRFYTQVMGLEESGQEGPVGIPARVGRVLPSAMSAGAPRGSEELERAVIKPAAERPGRGMARRHGWSRPRLPLLWGRNGAFEPRPLARGDEVTLSVEGIGELTNTIVAGAEPLPVPTARRRAGARV